jgi:hypothetical protein
MIPGTSGLFKSALAGQDRACCASGGGSRRPINGGTGIDRRSHVLMPTRVMGGILSGSSMSSLVLPPRWRRCTATGEWIGAHTPPASRLALTCGRPSTLLDPVDPGGRHGIQGGGGASCTPRSADPQPATPVGGMPRRCHPCVKERSRFLLLDVVARMPPGNAVLHPPRARTDWPRRGAGSGSAGLTSAASHSCLIHARQRQSHAPTPTLAPQDPHPV